MICTETLHPCPGEGQLVLGYVRALPGRSTAVSRDRARLEQWTAGRELALGEVFFDVTSSSPLERYGFRRLQGVVRRLRPVGVVVPSARHVADDHDDLARALGYFRAEGSLLLVLDSP
ncbi:hypothetical protein [Saccharothrix xinjiangensis]|uniref:Resolvase-like protein n=1 Tax=Saccharothrix xinjiangensis TaxID=204798 RepID=A0ABV9Y9B0_9PSEU